jgi:hypothetical protein
VNNKIIILAALCALGTILPLYQFVPWLIANGLNIPLFFDELYSNRVGGFFGNDVIVSALVLFVFIFFEVKKLEINRWWLPVVATFLVGVSLGLPLFLIQRELADKNAR